MNDEHMIRKIVEGVRNNSLVCMDIRGLKIEEAALGELFAGLAINGKITSLIVDDFVLQDASISQVVSAILTGLKQLERVIYSGLNAPSIIENKLNLRHDRGLQPFEVHYVDLRRFPPSNQSTYLDMQSSSMRMLFDENSPELRSRPVSSAGLDALSAVAGLIEKQRSEEIQRKLDVALQCNETLVQKNSELKEALKTQQEKIDLLNSHCKTIEVRLASNKALLEQRAEENKKLSLRAEELTSVCDGFKPELDAMREEANQISAGLDQSASTKKQRLVEDGLFGKRRAVRPRSARRRNSFRTSVTLSRTI